MADDSNASDGANGTTTPAATPPATNQNGAGSDEPATPSHRDWNSMAATQRDISKGLSTLITLLTPQAQPKQQEPKKATTDEAKAAPGADVLEEVHRLRADINFKDALTESDVPLSKGQRKQIEKLYKAERPSDVATWLKETFTDLDIKPPVAAKTDAGVSTTLKIPDLGQPGVDRKAHLPDDVMLIPAAAWKAMSPEEQRTAYESQKRKSGGGNPFADKRGVPLIPKKG